MKSTESFGKNSGMTSAEWRMMSRMMRFLRASMMLTNWEGIGDGSEG